MEKFINANYKKMSKKEMANILGISYNKVDWIMRKLNLKHYKSIKYNEEELKFIKENYPIHGSKYCADKLGRSENAINKKIKKMGLIIKWKHQYIDANGYLRNCEDRNNKYLIHRRIVEEHLNRKLKHDEIVHHKDGNKLNNSIENLEVLSRSEYTKIHNKYLKECQYKI